MSSRQRTALLRRGRLPAPAGRDALGRSSAHHYPDALAPTYAPARICALTSADAIEWGRGDPGLHDVCGRGGGGSGLASVGVVLAVGVSEVCRVVVRHAAEALGLDCRATPRQLRSPTRWVG